HVDIAGKPVLYAGAVRTTAGGTSDAAAVRTSDAVIVAAPYGEAHHRFPPLPGAIDAAIDWTRTALAADRCPVLFVDSVLDGLEVASRLAAEGIAVAGGRPLREAAQRIADLAASAIPAIAAPGREPRAMVWLEPDRAGLARIVG